MTGVHCTAHHPIGCINDLLRLGFAPDSHLISYTSLYRYRIEASTPKNRHSFFSTFFCSPHFVLTSRYLFFLNSISTSAIPQGLWGLISSQSSISKTDTDTDIDLCDRVRSYSYEKRTVTQSDVEQLSKEYDIVIIASGAGEI